MALAITTAAQAAPVAIRTGDLDLDTTTGQAVFHQRAEQAAKAFCKTMPDLVSRIRMGAPCVTALRAEALEKLAVVQQARRVQPERYAAR